MSSLSTSITQDKKCPFPASVGSTKRPKRLSLVEIITQIEIQIQGVLAQGYSPEDVCSVLGKRNIAISPVTLKRYLKRVEGGKGDEKGERSTDPDSPALGGKKRLGGEVSEG